MHLNALPQRHDFYNPDIPYYTMYDLYGQTRPTTGYSNPRMRLALTAGSSRQAGARSLIRSGSRPEEVEIRLLVRADFRGFTDREARFCVKGFASPHRRRR